MGRTRKRKYMDLYLNEGDYRCKYCYGLFQQRDQKMMIPPDVLERLRKGYTISKQVNGALIAIHRAKDRKIHREVARLRAKIAELEGRK